MIGKTILVNEKSYTIKSELKFGEYRRITALNTRLNQLGIETDEEKLLSLSPDQLKAMAMELGPANDELNQTIVDFLSMHLGLDQMAMDDLDLLEAFQLFQKTFGALTKVNETLKKTSETQLS